MVGGLNAVEFLLVNAPGGYFFWTKKPSLSTECWDIWPRVTREQSRLFALALVARRGGDLDNLLVVEGEVFSKFPENSACFGSFWPKGERFRLSLGPRPNIWTELILVSKSRVSHLSDDLDLKIPRYFGHKTSLPGWTRGTSSACRTAPPCAVRLSSGPGEARSA